MMAVDLLEVVDVVEEVETTAGFEVVEVVGVNIGKIVDVGEIVDICAVVAGAGAGSFMVSTQYDFPTTRLPQSAVMEGFCSPH